MTSIRDISATTKLAAVIGQPIKHSKSPAIYNYCFDHAGLNMVYLAFETSESETVDRIRQLQALGARGINVTMPGKVEALQCVSKLDPVARYVQAINMIVKENNQWAGYNTDGKGFWGSVKAQGQELVDKKIVLFGSGSTARVILAQAVVEGSKQVTIIARGLERPLAIKDVIEQLEADYPTIKINLLDQQNEEQLKQALWEADIVVQTTSVGMSPHQDQSILKDSDWLNPNSFICDIVYEPRETLFLKQAKKRGCQTLGGIHMLVYQASFNYQLFTGEMMPVADVLSILESK